jgi:pyruvate formate lyase activating enzyme
MEMKGAFMPNGHTAMLWEPGEGGLVQCELCAHRCTIAPGQLGRCRVRKNIDGELRTFTFSNVIACNPDPIEKKPLFHFLPGTRSLSIATPGCNFTCGFCQNWQISQLPRSAGGQRSGRPIPPEQLVRLAEQHDCVSISYTYTEPTIFFELAYETARLARPRGVRNCFVSNGYMTPQAVETIAPLLDAINVDLKAFDNATYRDVCGGRLEPVLDSLRALVAAGVWVEVTTLIVPGMNDSAEELTALAEFIAGELHPAVPWHISRFRPEYNMPDGQATPLATLEAAARIGKRAGLKYVYCGNVAGLADESTHCPACDAVVIDRRGFTLRSNSLHDGSCPACGESIHGVWG